MFAVFLCISRFKIWELKMQTLHGQMAYPGQAHMADQPYQETSGTKCSSQMASTICLPECIQYTQKIGRLHAFQLAWFLAITFADKTMQIKSLQTGRACETMHLLEHGRHLPGNSASCLLKPLPSSAGRHVSCQ